jgi:hypothetical protein
MNLRLYATIFALAFSLLYGIEFVYLAHGDVLNHYPYISPDGFDWYMEGVYLVKLLGGGSLPDLPVLRPPLFVFVTAADYLAGNLGLVVAFVLGLAIFCTYFFSLKIIDSVYGRAERNAWYLVPLAIGTTVYSLNFFKPFLLADGLSVALALASVYLLIVYHTGSKLHLLVLSVVVAVIAGMTQTYALIPYLVICGMGTLLYFGENKSRAIKYLGAAIAVSFLFVSLTALWRWVMPHGMTPSNFDLLKLSTGMFGFYVNTWSYYFFPLGMFFIIFRRYKIVFDFKNLVVVSTAVIVFLFVMLSFFYQWPEARFTYYFWPWLMILIFIIVQVQTRKGVYLLSVLMLMIVALAPDNYWSPSWKSVRVEVIHNWVGNYFSATSVDRKLDSCGSDCEGKNEFLKNSDPYINSTVKIYNKIKGL